MFDRRGWGARGVAVGAEIGERDCMSIFKSFLLLFGVQCNALLCLPITPLVKIYIIALGVCVILEGMICERLCRVMIWYVGDVSVSLGRLSSSRSGTTC